MVVTRPYKLPSYTRLPLWPAPCGALRVSENSFTEVIVTKTAKSVYQNRGYMNVTRRLRINAVNTTPRLTTQQPPRRQR
jgi:hypothetical protein